MVKVILSGALLAIAAVPAPGSTVEEYAIKFFHLPIGRATFEEIRQGSDRTEVIVRGRTNFLGSLIYSVDNTYKASIDGADRRPLSLEKMIAEKSVRESLTVLFDHRGNTAKYGGRMAVPIPSGTHNFFSALLHLRDLEPSTRSAEFPLIVHGKVWQATCRFDRKERLEAGGEEVLCKVIEVRVRDFDPDRKGLSGRPDILSKELVHPESELTLWLTDEADPRYVRLAFRRSPFEVRLTLSPRRVETD